MKEQFKFYLFGDQTYDVYTQLRELLHSQNDPILTSFFERAYYALRAEIGQLPPKDREELPRLSGIADLLSWGRWNRGRSVALDMALTCMYQLGSFISQAGASYPSLQEACLLGLCTGSLAAAAISCSGSILELLPVAVETVLVAFRTGMCVLDVRNRIESSNESSFSWSIVVSGLEAVEAVRRFCQEKNLPLTARPYISAYALNCLTISGPPSGLGELCKSEWFSKSKTKQISIWAPYHAPHLFSQEDKEEILRTTLLKNLTNYKTRIPVLSSTTGELIKAADYESLLRVCLKQILLEPIRWEEMLKGIINVLQRTDSSTFSVVPFATVADQTISSALKQISLNGLPVPLPEKELSTSDNVQENHIGDRKRSKIAIIGISGRFPSAKDNDAFWDLLYQGLDVHKEVPPLHWDAKTHMDVTGVKKNTSATSYGCWLDNPAAFDARFFNMSPREAPQVDPAQRIALMTAYEAIEQAGIVPDATPSTMRDRVGVFYGVTSNDWMETNSAQNIDTYFIPGGNRAFIPGRINYFFKFSGPSYAVDTACSSSLAAIHIACNSLWRGDIDTAIAGGTNVLTNPDFTAGLDRGHFLSRTGNCKTFDDSADGYCRGEGVGTVILKRLEDAIADNDPIQGLILGAYTNHSAEAESITRPHVGAQRAIFSKILDEAGVDPYSISYVEMHGTGTQAGDAGEMQSVLDIFAPRNAIRRRREDEILYLGSAKANIGHGEAASGVSSLAKVLLMMQKDAIPPHCGIKTKINHKFPADIEERNVRIALKPVPWKRIDTTPRRVFVNNFSAAGGNSALLLEDAPVLRTTNDADPRSSHVVAISAKCPASLKGNLKSMLGFLERQNDLSLGKLSYTSTARRIHHLHRVMVTGSSCEEVRTQLEVAIRDQFGMTRPKSAPKVIFTFTGQGAQFPGMGKQLLEGFSQFRADIRRLDQTGRSLGFPSIMPIFQADAVSNDISDFSPVIVQLASVCMQMALTRLLASWGIVPHAVVGHSLGEYAALNVAGVLSDADTVYLVGKRAQLLHEMCTRDTHSMLVVKASTETIVDVLKGTNYEVACINSPIETVLSGTTAEIVTIQNLLADVGLKLTILKVPYAFHSSQVDPILLDFEKIAHGATFRKPSVPVLCPLDGNLVTEAGTFGPAYLARHCREPVNMLKALRSAQSNQEITDQTFMIEIGPHPAVSGMVKATLGSQMVVLSMSQRNTATWHVLTGMLKTLYCAGADICWAEYHRDFKSSHFVIHLPAYSWDLKDYWIQYVNDWSLRKGDPPLVIKNTSNLESTTVHKVVDESSEGNNVTLIVESDIARPDLNPLVKGHKVDGVPLCTPSVYADIALTLGKYLLDRYRPLMEERLIDISNMVISKALIEKSQGPQLLQTHAAVDWSTKSAILRFSTFDKKGLPTVEHAKCIIQFTDRSQLQVLNSKAYELKQRMQTLRKGIQHETAARFNRAMVYKMIRPLAQFHEDYRAIEEVVLNSHTLEASSRVNFSNVKKGGTFHTHPAIIDGLTQSCGFVMNCNDAADLDIEVFVNHGWASFQLFEEISTDKEYRTFTQMVEGKDKMWEGDVVVFEGEKIVASFKRVTIQGVPRRVLQYILSVESGQKLQMRQTTEVTAPSQEVPKTTQAAQPPSIPAKPEAVKSSKFPKALQIISEESGIALADLTDSSSFADMGIDSLLSLTITARFREELDLDINFDSMFVDYPTVKNLKKFLEPAEQAVEQVTEQSAVTEVIAALEEPKKNERSVVLCGFDFMSALKIISEESGVAITDFTDDSMFSDVGIDSLLSLIIISRFREELDVDINMDSLFMDYPTVGTLKTFLTGGTTEASVYQEPQYLSSSSDDGSTPSDEKVGYETQVTLLSSAASDIDDEVRLIRPATSVVLQGVPKNCQKTLFLFPDGSGSATSYASLPRIDPDISVIGLNSPYLKDPHKMKTCPLDELIEGYLNEIRRRQPNGPYDLGGWSAGGILAYRAAQILIDQGEQVLSLILIDSPVPKGLDRLPQHFYDFCDSLNLFGHAAAGVAPVKPDWLIPHFNAIIDVLHDYWAEPLPESQYPNVFMIWACDSIMDGGDVPTLPPHPDDTEGMKFLTEKRTDFSGNGWEDLFANRQIVIERAVGANHFSMMRGSHAVKLGEFIRNAMQ